MAGPSRQCQRHPGGIRKTVHSEHMHYNNPVGFEGYSNERVNPNHQDCETYTHTTIHTILVTLSIRFQLLTLTILINMNNTYIAFINVS